MIKINFICERCNIKSEDITIDGFVIPFKSVPDNFLVFLDKQKPIFMCKKCGDYNEALKPEPEGGEWVSQYHENPVGERN